jgi:hypothetical protein
MKKICKYFKYTLGLLIVVPFLSSCEDPVQIKLDEGESLIVVDAFVTDANESQTIRLTESAPYFYNASTPGIAGANVLIRDIDNNKVYNFSDVGNGNYVFTPSAIDTFGVIGHHYRLELAINGATYESNSTLFRTSKLDTILFRTEEDAGFNAKDGLYPLYVGSDIGGEKNYYWFKTYKNNVFYSSPRLMNLSDDGGGGGGTDGLFFTPPVAFFNVTPNSNPFQPGDQCRLDMISLNPSTFEFLLQAQTQMNNSESGLFATTPENVRTNIQTLNEGSKKAIGWFNVGSMYRKIQTAQE